MGRKEKRIVTGGQGYTMMWCISDVHLLNTVLTIRIFNSLKLFTVEFLKNILLYGEYSCEFLQCSHLIGHPLILLRRQMGQKDFGSKCGIEDARHEVED